MPSGAAVSASFFDSGGNGKGGRRRQARDEERGESRGERNPALSRTGGVRMGSVRKVVLANLRWSNVPTRADDTAPAGVLGSERRPHREYNDFGE